MGSESPADAYLRDLLEAYESLPLEQFHRRLTGWKSSADQAVLTFALLREVRELRQEIAAVRESAR